MTEDTHSPEDLGFELPQAGKTSRARVIAVFAIIVVAGVGFGLYKYNQKRAAIPTQGEESKDEGAGTGRVRVEVMQPKVLGSDRALTLPGAVKPLESTAVYPRVTGFVRKWNVDIGDKVTAGTVLAEVDTPELDAQISQARAQLAAAHASVAQMNAQQQFSKSNAARNQTLADQKLISQATVEQTQAQAQTDQANLDAAKSNVTAQEANLRRMVEMQSYAKVVAPFAGTVTTRNIDRGALVSEGSTVPMFNIVATDPVRIFVDVPQSVAPSVKIGGEAKVTTPAFGAREFTGKVTRSAGALDPDLHTMPTEIQVPNPDNALYTGMYVQVALALSVPHKVLEIPSTALYSDAQGLRVAAIGPGNKIHFLPISVERDTGATLQISTGLTGDEKILRIAIPTLSEGDVVDVAPPKAPPPAAPAAAGSGSGSAAPTVK